MTDREPGRESGIGNRESDDPGLTAHGRQSDQSGRGEVAARRRRDRFPIPDSRFPIPDSRFPIPDSRFNDRANHAMLLAELERAIRSRRSTRCLTSSPCSAVVAAFDTFNV
ncbi:MAG TPA: hypothetical protein VM076_13475 [Gemmatimonadaceae bacterium]|nr:hypothetical protein [Gemmatimonadaceae bacterium]